MSSAITGCIKMDTIEFALQGANVTPQGVRRRRGRKRTEGRRRSPWKLRHILHVPISATSNGCSIIQGSRSTSRLRGMTLNGRRRGVSQSRRRSRSLRS